MERGRLVVVLAIALACLGSCNGEPSLDTDASYCGIVDTLSQVAEWLSFPAPVEVDGERSGAYRAVELPMADESIVVGQAVGGAPAVSFSVPSPSYEDGGSDVHVDLVVALDDERTTSELLDIIERKLGPHDATPIDQGEVRRGTVAPGFSLTMENGDFASVSVTEFADGSSGVVVGAGRVVHLNERTTEVASSLPLGSVQCKSEG